MKKVIISGLAVIPVAANAISGSCEALGNTVTGSFSQAWAYAHCVGDSLATAWELFVQFF